MENDGDTSNVGKGLSRFSKYSRAERKRIGTVTAVLSGDPVRVEEPKGIKYGIRVWREATDDEYKKQIEQDGYKASRFIHLFDRWYASKKQRNDALPRLKRNYHLAVPALKRSGGPVEVT